MGWLSIIGWLLLGGLGAWVACELREMGIERKWHEQCLRLDLTRSQLATSVRRVYELESENATLTERNKWLEAELILSDEFRKIAINRDGCGVSGSK